MDSSAQRLDPFEQADWTIAIALAWIVWRDRDKVRLHSQESAADVLHAAMLEASEEADAIEKSMIDGPVARDELWKALQYGTLIAYGALPHSVGLSDAIPAHQWKDLDLHLADDSIARFNDLKTRYTSVRLSRKEVMKHDWPTVTSGVAKSNADEERAIRKLEALMSGQKDRPLSKADAFDKLGLIFGPRSQRRIWDEAIRRSGAFKWSEPGVRPAANRNATPL